jgi:hypothetical protein
VRDRGRCALFLWTDLPQVVLLVIGVGIFVLVLTPPARLRARSGGLGFRA